MSLFIVDVESDGPCPGLFSMVSFGVVRVQEDLKNTPTFFSQVAPISPNWVPDALAVSKISREVHEGYADPKVEMFKFHTWLIENNKGRPVFISDNPAFDWQWINYYFHAYLGDNPFGFSARRIGDLYSGLKKDWFAASKWKSMRKTAHTHHPVDDARGNAEALVQMLKEHNVKVPY